MDFSSFLGEKRWEILETIAARPSSPVELAEELSATVSYMSQQLKLLEVAGLVYKTKTGSAEKGKPRNVYSISQEFVHLSSVTRDFSEKKMLYLNEYHKNVISIWNLSDTTLHAPLNELYFEIKKHGEKISAVFLDKVIGDVLIVSDNKEVIQKIASAAKKISARIRIDSSNKDKADSKLGENHVLMFNGERVDKGGING